MDYHPRLTDAGMRSSVYWTYRYGTQTYSAPMPNCCPFCMGRVHELWVSNGGSFSDIVNGYDPSWWRAGPTYGNAEQWWSQAGTNPAHGWTRSATPQLGAIACWGDYNGLGGHVAIVEEIRSDGYVNMSQSHYPNGPYFDMTGFVKPVQGQTGGGYPGRFQGYLINPLTAGQTPGSPTDGGYGGLPFLVFRRGDWVKIIAAGNASSYGRGRKAYGIGWKRQVKKVYEGRPFPYEVGFLSGGTTGFYKADALKKV